MESLQFSLNYSKSTPEARVHIGKLTSWQLAINKGHLFSISDISISDKYLVYDKISIMCIAFIGSKMDVPGIDSFWA